MPIGALSLFFLLYCLLRFISQHPLRAAYPSSHNGAGPRYLVLRGWQAPRGTPLGIRRVGG